MKLFFAPGACSLSPHIALREAGLPFDLEQVDLKSKQTKSGADYRTINPKGAVPALQLDNGQVLTEGAAIVQYIGDQKPASKLTPPAGSFERYRLQEWLNYIASEVHKQFSPLFNPNSPEERKQEAKTNLGNRFDFVAKSLDGKQYLMGDTFTAADCYLFTMLGWAKHTGIDLGRWPSLKSYAERVGARPAASAALKAEGLA
ncbi:MAG: glutathione transferase GstA [Candidatus Binataceae bacterium]